MSKSKVGFFLGLFLALVFCGGTLCLAQSQAAVGTSAVRHTPPSPSAACAKGQMRCVTAADRLAAAQRVASKRPPVAQTLGGRSIVALPQLGSKGVTSLSGVKPNALAGPFFPQLVGCYTPVNNPGGMPDYMSGCMANYANSPLPVTDLVTGAYISGGMRKFIDPLPNIPVAHPDTKTYRGSDYYEISEVEYTQQMHSDLPNPTRLRGYVQTNSGTDGSGNNTIAPAAVQYDGPLIIAQKNRPVRVKFTNHLPTGAGGDLFIPVDTTVMGSGMGPDGTPYLQNRGSIHLHGGATPWISDGTPHQWTTPVGASTNYPKGVSVRDVPDMPATGPGEMTFYYTNQQSARLMFYHDHAYGVTRLNVYAGVAAGYLVQDTVEATLVNGGTITPPVGPAVTVPPGTIPADQLPLVIQDKTFIPSPAQLTGQDNTWNWGPKDGSGNFLSGNLWFPHTYMPNQNPSDLSGVNAMGRWDWGPWFWPPMDPSSLLQGEVPCPNATNPDQVCPGTPNPSLVPEAFMDTPVVNGTAYPYVKVDPKPYRLRILNASNDRTLNLSLYQGFDDIAGTACTAPVPNVASGKPSTCTEVKFVTPPDGIASMGPIPDPLTKGPNMIQIGTEGGFLPAPVILTNSPISYNYNRRDIVVLNIADKNLLLGPAERGDVIVDFSAFAGKTLILYNDSPAPVPAFDTRYDYYTGDADQTTTGGAPTTLAGYGPNTRTVMQIQVGTSNQATYDPTALIAAMPAAFAASQDAPIITEAAYGPAYNTTYKNSYSRIQDTSLFQGTLTGVSVTAGGAGYTSVPTVTISGGGGSGATATAVITAGSVSSINLITPGANYTFTPTVTISGGGGKGAVAVAVGVPMLRKTIQELFELNYGRMNATLGTEMAFTNYTTQTTIPLGYIDPPTENFGDGETQVWKITHNGVDTHAIHFHLFNVQVINRVGWDGAVRVPDANELGWKETVRMNPLEDVIVALRPVKQTLPWPLPDSIRLQDVTSPKDAQIAVIDSLNGNPTTVANENINFGQEYVWHCHLLGHEENDMMRPMIFQVPPEFPTNLVATQIGNGHPVLTWTDNSLSETGFILERSTTANMANPVLIPVAGVTGYGSTVTYTDTSAASGNIYYYAVQAINNAAFNGYDATGAMLIKTISSAWSNIVHVGIPVVSITPTSLAFGNQLINVASAAKVITMTNAGSGTLTLVSIVASGTNAADFSQTNNCTNLLGGASCTINVKFTPAATGARTGTYTITTNDPANPTVAISMTGTGARQVMTLSPASLAFGNQNMLATSAAQTVTVSNATGTWPLTITNITRTGTNAADFASTNTCGAFPATVAAGATCTVSVTFTPSASGARAGTLNVIAAAPVGTQSVSLSGTGVPVAANLTQPLPAGSVLGATQIFKWSTGAGFTAYQLMLGTTGVGSSNSYNSGQINVTTSPSITLPVGGGTLFVRLYSISAGLTTSYDYTFIEPGTPVIPVLTTPTPGTALTGGSPQVFTWTKGSGIQAYQFRLGTVLGSNNVYGLGVTSALSTASITLPAAGKTLYARLYWEISNVWYTQDYTYTTK